jgi:hypothetical protein
MNSKTGWARVRLVLAVGVMFATFALRMNAQVKTDTSKTRGESTQEVSVEHGEVVHVSGNDLVVKMEDGSIRHFPNVPESARVDVDGQSLGIHDLKPGMKLQRSITVTSTPETVTTVMTVKGRVWHVNAPASVILTLEDGTNQEFKVPNGQKFMINGQETDVFNLKKGMVVSATKIIETPQIVVDEQRRITGKMPPPPPAPPADEPILIAMAVPVPAPAAPAAPEAPAELPKTGSLLPLVGLLGGLFVLTSLGLMAARRSF